MKVEEENIREMEFGDAYDSIPAQVWPYLKWNWNDFFSSILFKWINNVFFQDRDEFISDFGALYDEQQTDTNCHFAMVLAKKY